MFEPSITENAETALVFSQDNGDSEMESRDTQPCLRSIEKSRLSGIKRHLPLALPLQASSSPSSRSVIDIEEHEAIHEALGQESSVSL